MHIGLKGSTFVISGTLATMTRAEIKAAVEQGGGVLAGSLTTETSALIVLRCALGKYSKAKNMGVPVLYDDDFRALLDGEIVEVELQVGRAGEHGVDELFGEARSVMQGTPSPEMWHELVRLLDACRAEDAHVLAEYIDTHIARWSTEDMKGQVGTIIDVPAVTQSSPGSFVLSHHKQGVVGELRVAPEHWIAQIQQGVVSPKYRIIRALDLTRSKLTNTAVSKLIAHPMITHLELLRLPERPVPSKKLIKLVCALPELHSLQLGQIDERAAPAFLEYGASKMGPLRMLDLSRFGDSSKLRTPSRVCEFARAPYFETVTSLHVKGEGGHFEWMFIDEMSDQGLLPAVEHVHFSQASRGRPASFLAGLLRMSWASARLRRVTAGLIEYRPSSDQDWSDALAVDFGGHLDLLDLSGFSDAQVPPHHVQTLGKLLERELPTSLLLRHVGTLILGEWKTQRLTEQLAHAFPSLTVE